MTVRDLYDRWARIYDWNPVMALVRPARRRAVNAMGLATGDTVVDMGTGTGANLPLLREAVGPRGRVVGVDLSPGMLSRARRRIERRDWDNVTLVEADIRDPPLDGPVDGILSSFVVLMYPDPDRLVDAWAAHLDHGTMVNMYAAPSRRWYHPAVNRLLGLYLRAFEEGWGTASEDPKPLDVLRVRGTQAKEALAERTSRLDHDTVLFGLVQIDIGRFDE